MWRMQTQVVLPGLLLGVRQVCGRKIKSHRVPGRTGGVLTFRGIPGVTLPSKIGTGLNRPQGLPTVARFGWSVPQVRRACSIYRYAVPSRADGPWYSLAMTVLASCVTGSLPALVCWAVPKSTTAFCVARTTTRRQ